MNDLVGSVWRLKEGRGLPYRYRILEAKDGRVILQTVYGDIREKTISLRTLRGDYERVKA